jgi:15-cis-phytoene synthase
MSLTAMPESTASDDRLAIVRAYDYDRYISALLAPAARRADLMLLYAFDAELARIPATVSEPMLGEIRLQWWRDALAPLLTDAGRTTPSLARTGHPLADEFVELARARKLPGGLIHGLIDARSTDLSDTPLRDEGELLSHLAKTDGAILTLAARLLTTTPPPDLDRVTVSAGRAIGLVRLARRLASGHPHAETLVPLTVWPLDERHTHADDPTADARFAAARRKAMQDLAALAQDAALSARAELSRLPPELRPAFLPLALVPRYVTHMRRVSEAPALERHDINPLVRLWTLWRARHKRAPF